MDVTPHTSEKGRWPFCFFKDDQTLEQALPSLSEIFRENWQIDLKYNILNSLNCMNTSLLPILVSQKMFEALELLEEPYKNFHSKNILKLPNHLFPLSNERSSISSGKLSALARVIYRERQHQFVRRPKVERVSNSLVVTYANPGTDWVSLAEVIPSLEKQWAMTQDRHHQVHFYRIGIDSFHSSIPSFLSAQKIIFLTLLPYSQVANLIIFLRTQLPITTPFIIYLYDNATMAAWRFHALKFAHLLRQDDHFIATCKGDLQAIKHCFQQAQVSLIPFSIAKKLSLSPLPKRNPQRNIIPLVYIGRLSEQKMIHLLILAMWYLKHDPSIQKIIPMKKIKLILWGEVDQLGSPNMGIESLNYKNYLFELCQRLDLSDQIEFKGFVPREKIYQELLNYQHIFVSASLHSDENFGMAALRSLLTGNFAVLSAWGGHRDFKAQFPSQVLTVNVHRSAEGPFISLTNLARTLTKMILRFTSKKDHSFSSTQYFNEDSIVKKLHILLKETKKNHGTPDLRTTRFLKKTELVNKILKQRKKILLDIPKSIDLHRKEFLANKIFLNYADPLARPFFEAYGMPTKALGSHEKPLELSLRKAQIHLLPWVFIDNKKLKSIIINDPHKGKQVKTLQRQQRQQRNIEIRNVFHQSYDISLNDLKWLVERGLVFTFTR